MYVHGCGCSFLLRGWQLLVVVALLLVSVAAAAPPGVAGRSGLIGHAAPGFSRPALTGQSSGQTGKAVTGKAIRLASYRGKVVLLNFWATWCGPCLTEIPQFSAWQRQYAGLQVVGVSMDDDAVPVRTALAKLQPGYPVVMGDTQLARLYGGIYGLPVTFVIDKRGTIRYRHRGAAPLPLLQKELASLLGASPR